MPALNSIHGPPGRRADVKTTRPWVKIFDCFKLFDSQLEHKFGGKVLLFWNISSEKNLDKLFLTVENRTDCRVRIGGVCDGVGFNRGSNSLRVIFILNS